jgi:hypothetical protein
VSESSRLFYEYSGKASEGETEYMVNIDELNAQLKWLQIEKCLGKERVEDVRKQVGGDGKRELFLDMHQAARENSPRSEIVKKIL